MWSFSYLVTCFLGIILVALGIEVFGPAHALSDALLEIGVAGLGAAIILASFRLHVTSMLLAERLASGATCPTCQTYAAFRVVASGPQGGERDGEAPDSPPWLRVCCSRCQAEWLIDSGKT